MANGRALDTLHVAFDEDNGFSAMLKMFDYDPSATLNQRSFVQNAAWTLRAPMLALANPNPQLAFPAGTVLIPQLLIRNTTSKLMHANLEFHWRGLSGKGSTDGPAFALQPFATALVDVTKLPEAVKPPETANWSAVYLSTDSKPDEVVALASSYDETLRYGAQTPFIDQLSPIWKGGQWEYDTTHNLLITVGNASKKAMDATFTMFYERAGKPQEYSLKEHLGPHDQMWVDVGQLIRTGRPDLKGRVLPHDLTSGSYEFSDEDNPDKASLYEGKVIYDTTYGHVSYGCAACCATQNVYVSYNPLSLVISGSATNGVTAQDSCGDPAKNVSSSFYNWTTANANIASTTAQGVHTGYSAGQTTSTTSGKVLTTNGRNGCYFIPYQPSGPAQVQPCPTIIGVTVLDQEALSAVYSQRIRTGLGAIAEMLASGPNVPYNGDIITEFVTLPPNGNGCSAYNVNPPTSMSRGPFTVGASTVDDTGVTMPGKTDVFYDHHTVTASTSLLPAGASCTITYVQEYQCGNQDVGPIFNIVFSLQAGTLNGSPVTNVTLSKQAQSGS